MDAHSGLDRAHFSSSPPPLLCPTPRRLTALLAAGTALADAGGAHAPARALARDQHRPDAARAMRCLRLALLLVVMVLVATSGALAWRLSQGPIALTWLEPKLRAMAARASPFAVRFTSPSLVWLPSQSALALQVRDLEARTLQGELVASAVMLRGAVLLRSLLLERRLLLVAAEIELPELTLMRDDEGRLSLQFGGQSVGSSFDAAAGGGLAGIFDNAPGGTDPRLAGLKAVTVRAPTLRFHDAASGAHATMIDAKLALVRDEAIWTASLAARVGTGGSSSAALPMSGTVQLVTDPATGARDAATFDLVAEAGEVAVEAIGLAPIAIHAGALRGRLAAGWEGVKIDQFHLAGEGFGLSGRGSIELLDGRLATDLQLTADDFDLPELLPLWPASLAADARSWVTENVATARIAGATLHLGEGSDRPGQPILGGSLAFSGLELRYHDDFPPAIDAAGTASLTGDSLVAQLAGGRTGEVDLGKSEVLLSNLRGAGVTRLAARLDLRSSLAAAFRLLDAGPLELSRTTGLSAGRIGGRQATSLTLKLPLIQPLPEGRLDYRADSRLTAVTIREFRPGYGLAADSVAVTAEPSGVSAEGSVRINGVAFGLKVREHAAPVNGVNRRIVVTGRADEAAASALRLDWPPGIGSSVAFDATVTERARRARTVDLRLDLRDTTVDVPAIGLVKRRGEAGTATVGLTQSDPSTLAIDRARVELPGWAAEGGAALALAPPRLTNFSLRRLKGPLGDLTARLALERGVWRGQVNIGVLDVRPLMAGGIGGPAAPAANQRRHRTAPVIPDFAVDLSAKRLQIGETPLNRLTGSLEHRGGVWQYAALRARVDGSDVRLDLNTAGRRSALLVRGSDAGWVLRSVASSDPGVRGGSFHLSADLDRSGGRSGHGQLKIHDFTLRGAPTLVRILSLASFSGLGSALTGQGIPVRGLVVPFRLRESVLTVEKGRLVSSDFGARADGRIDLDQQRIALTGTVAPAYALNRLLGRIPLLGPLMSGLRSDALLAATFTVSGQIAEPQVRVNPLTALVPGVIRELFAPLPDDERAR